MSQMNKVSNLHSSHDSPRWARPIDVAWCWPYATYSTNFYRLLIILPWFLQFLLPLFRLSQSWGSSDFILREIYMWVLTYFMEIYIIMFLSAYSWIHYSRRLDTSSSLFSEGYKVCPCGCYEWRRTDLSCCSSPSCSIPTWYAPSSFSHPYCPSRCY